jgi:ATP dependent DNA ligase domain
MLHLDGRSTRELRYERRRELLLDLNLDGPHWSTPRHFVAETERVLAATGEHGLEGVVVKRLGSPYLPGARNGAWVKYKHRRIQSFLVSGWSPPERRRSEGLLLAPGRIRWKPRARRERPVCARRGPDRCGAATAGGTGLAADPARSAHAGWRRSFGPRSRSTARREGRCATRFSARWLRSSRPPQTRRRSPVTWRSTDRTP